MDGKHPGGRPTKYDPAFCDTVMATGEGGGSLAEMAEACDVDRETINNWMAREEEFSRAVKRGLQKAQVWWERQGRSATFGDTDGFNATSYIFNMKNRFKDDWRDKVETEHSGGVKLTHTTDMTRLSNDELQAIIAGNA